MNKTIAGVVGAGILFALLMAVKAIVVGLLFKASVAALAFGALAVAIMLCVRAARRQR